MRTNLKAILAATAIAALASPVIMAQSESHRHAAMSATIANARGSVAHAHTSGWRPPSPVEEANPP